MVSFLRVRRSMKQGIYLMKKMQPMKTHQSPLQLEEMMGIVGQRVTKKMIKNRNLISML